MLGLHIHVSHKGTIAAYYMECNLLTSIIIR